MPTRSTQSKAIASAARRIETAALALGRARGFEEGHARQVTRLALHLFDQLGPLHGLSPGTRLVLRAAGLLHDIGITESFAGHHKRSCTMIMEAHLPVLSAKELLMTANIARYHRKRAPSLDDKPFAALDAAGQVAVRKLAAILRIADVLDREHQNLVHSITACIDGDVVVLTIDAAEGYMPSPDAWTKKTAMFEHVFGLRITVRREE